MNNAEDTIRQLLADAPFDDSYRREHRDEVRERALLAFDEAAADRIPTTLGVEDVSPRRSTRRRVARLGLAAAIAASLVGVLAAWYGGADRSTTAQGEAIAQADRRFIASLQQLNDFKDDQLAAAFDVGIDACLSEHYYQTALASKDSPRILAQPN
jgi:hypothetical protein